MSLTTALARAAGTVVVLVPLGVTTTISFYFGRDVFGGGSVLYGLMWASFATVSTVSTFTLFSSEDRGQRLASAVVLLLCLSCSITAGWMSIGSRQDELAGAAASRAALLSEVRQAADDIAALPAYRPQGTIEAEQAHRERGYAAAERAHRADKANARVPWQPSADDRARDLALINELGLVRRAADMRERLADLEARAARERGPSAVVVTDFVAKQIGWQSDTIGKLMTLLYVIAADIVAGLGPYCVLGSAHALPRPRRRAPLPLAETESEQHRAAPAPEVVPEPQPVAAQAVEQPAVAEDDADPVAAFLRTATEADEDAVTAYADIESAWKGWCTSRGIDGSTVSLGFALGRCGYPSVRMSGSRRMGRKGLRISLRQAA